MNYHVEHHDFPEVPWRRLPALRAAAPEFYDSIVSFNDPLKVIYDTFDSPRFYAGANKFPKKRRSAKQEKPLQDYKENVLWRMLLDRSL